MKRLLVFSVVYSIITTYFIYKSQHVAHGGEVIVVILPIIWIVGAIILLLLYLSDKQILSGNINKVLAIFCTPIPTWLFLLGNFIWFTEFESQKIEKITNKDGYIVKQTDYPYRKRTTFRSNFDSPNGELLLDSVVYYDQGKYKKNIYKGWERLLQDN